MRFLPLSRDNKPLVAYKNNPLLENGLEYGTWVEEAVRAGYGVGTFLDTSGLVVIDTDSTIDYGRRSKQVFGWANFQDVCRETGLSGIPETFTVRTKTPGHYHFYFRQHPDYPLTRTSIHSQIPQVDVKVTGYVVSWYTEGYEIVRAADIEVLPPELGRRLYRRPVHGVPGDQAAGQGDRSLTEDFAGYLLTQVAQTADGERNMTLYKAAAVFRDGGLTDAYDRNRLMQAAVSAGLRETEAERTIESAWRLSEHGYTSTVDSRRRSRDARLLRQPSQAG